MPPPRAVREAVARVFPFQRPGEEIKKGEERRTGVIPGKAELLPELRRLATFVVEESHLAHRAFDRLALFSKWLNTRFPPRPDNPDYVFYPARTAPVQTAEPANTVPLFPGQADAVEAAAELVRDGGDKGDW
ncbi:MAG: hypothetical protein HYU97_00120 [Deltaproteobacteria bacterium]|nr:hypothetical protein [Deltaproteobacteria bacterium]